MDHLVEDRREVVDDLVLQGGRETLPHVVGSAGHGTSHCAARAKRSVIASCVSFVGVRGRGAVRLVEARGRRKVMWSR
jgi:hypothetical protein